ncbi:helix-turn-helix domain-containing protein [Mycolicibacterium peregrinum]|uniref:helix-turn-helix domain-containing protein n=1 Tax=Mycolicibacterium peregrinum TaxID=43304 RepID=UPI003AAE5C1E
MVTENGFHLKPDTTTGLDLQNRLKLAKEFGAVTALVYELIYHQDADEPLSRDQVAEVLGIGSATVSRCLKKLTQEGLLKTAKGRYANCYQVVTVAPSLHQIDTVTQLPTVSTRIDSDVEEQNVCSSFNQSFNSEYLWENASPCRWYTPTSVAPADPGHHLAAFSPEIMQFLAFFEYYAAPRSGTKVTMTRRKKWLNQCLKHLVSGKLPLHKVTALVTWIFVDCDGELPISVPKKDKKLTRPDQIFWYFHQLVIAAENGLTPKSLAREANVKVNYNRPLDDAVMESQVAELVNHYAEFWSSLDGNIKLNEFKLENWAKSFRILLHHDRASFDDALTVVTNLKRFDRHIDTDRFLDAFWVRAHFAELNSLIPQLIAAYEKRASA